MPQITTSKRRRANKKNRIPFAVATVAIACIIVYIVINARGRKVTEEEASKSSEEFWKTTSPVSVADAKVVPPVKTAPKRTKIEKTISNEDQAAPIETASRTNNSPVIITAPEKKPSGFNGGSAEQIIAMMVSASDKTGMPPLPPMGSEEKIMKAFAFAITNDIVVYDDDDEKTVAFKEQVALFKNEIAEIVKNGGSITNVVAEYTSWVNQKKEMRKDVILEYRRLSKEVSKESADLFLIEANKDLEAEGVEPVNFNRIRPTRTNGIKTEL